MVKLNFWEKHTTTKRIKSKAIRWIRGIMDKVISALLGTIIGFLLSWIKEFFQNRPKIKVELKNGSLNYINIEANDYGDIVTSIVEPREANTISLKLKFDIFNVGKVSTGITDISIKLSVRKDKLHYQPKVTLPYDNKQLNEISFNLESNKVSTIFAELDIPKEEPNIFIFNDVALAPYDKDRLRIEVVVTALHKKRLSLVVEPVSILTAGDYT